MKKRYEYMDGVKKLSNPGESNRRTEEVVTAESVPESGGCPTEVLHWGSGPKSPTAVVYTTN